jgi:hypothetical protein
MAIAHCPACLSRHKAHNMQDRSNRGRGRTYLDCASHMNGCRRAVSAAPCALFILSVRLKRVVYLRPYAGQTSVQAPSFDY